MLRLALFTVFRPLNRTGLTNVLGNLRIGLVLLMLSGWSYVHAAPFLNLSLEGRKFGSNADFTDYLDLNLGDIVEYRLRVDLSPIGTTNVQHGQTRTITETVPGRDGANSLSLLTLFQSANDGVQMHFDSPAVLQNGWESGTGARGGVPTPRAGSAWNNLVDVRPIHDVGVFTGVDPETVFTGAFSVQEVSGPFANLDLLGTALFGMKITSVRL